MPWVRIDDEFYNHPKVSHLDELLLPCVGLHVLALCYCNSYLTDGRIPHGQVHRLAGDLAKLLPEGHPWVLVRKLIEVGLWEEQDEKGNYVIHDFLDYNPSKCDVVAKKALKAEQGRAGGLAKAKRTASELLAKTCPVPDPVPKDPDQHHAVRASKESPCDSCSRLLGLLNSETGKSYRVGAGLHARHTEHGEPKVEQVIRHRLNEWRGTKWEKYLRPETLFGPEKFDSYLNAATVTLIRPVPYRIEGD